MNFFKKHKAIIYSIIIFVFIIGIAIFLINNNSTKHNPSKINQKKEECNNLNSQTKLLELNPLRYKYEIEGLTNILRHAQNYKKDLNKRLEQNKQSALSSLNSLCEITSAEG